jgi:hypothetical protein
MAAEEGRLPELARHRALRRAATSILEGLVPWPPRSSSSPGLPAPRHARVEGTR